MQIRAIADADRRWAEEMVLDAFGSTRFAFRGELFETFELPALVAVDGSDGVGVLAYAIEGDVLEIMVLVAGVRGRGVATALIEAVEEVARRHHCRRLRVGTTNHNLDALRRYQLAGFRLTELRPGAVDTARALKPEIPLEVDGIPLRDELELEKDLG